MLVYKSRKREAVRSALPKVPTNTSVIHTLNRQSATGKIFQVKRLLFAAKRDSEFSKIQKKGQKVMQ